MAEQISEEFARKLLIAEDRVWSQLSIDVWREKGYIKPREKEIRENLSRTTNIVDAYYLQKELIEILDKKLLDKKQ